MRFLATLLFVFLALPTLGACVGNLHQATRKAAHPVATLVIGLTGLSFVVAAVTVWTNVPLALALGVWPVLLFTVLRATGVITVISRLSTGE